MEYENRPPPEGINVSDQHPLVDFFWMLAAVALVATVLVVALSLGAGWLARQIPMAQENRWSDAYLAQRPVELSETALRKQRWLQDLADRLSPAMDLGPDTTIHVRYVEDDEVINAFATLGGNIVIYSGLLNSLDTENALAMVMAHEIAHIKHRDPITALGRGAAVALGLSAISGVSDSAMAQRIVGNVGMLTGLSFSRGQENAADQQAIEAMLAHYGHLNGAATLFEKLQAMGSGLMPEILATHPLTEKRIDRLARATDAQSDGEITALPDWLSTGY
ncbi:MAG: M48 family metallopeptidase [Alcanivoracaceae bacterium]|nr:M48 family metallopeptidase [Alcanivoracaceae bacterium]